MNTTLDRSQLRSRYRFTGALVLDTALHIGGGREASTITDSPIVRDGMGRPIIPGSSFKGAFRAAVERLLPNLSGFSTCALDPGDKCLSGQKKVWKERDDGENDKTLSDAYRVVSEAASRGNAINDSNALQTLKRTHWQGQEVNETHLLDLLDEFLCDTCKTFGSIHLASVARFHDLPLHSPEYATLTQIRDGVGIDRDSERAVDQIKFDFEIVPAKTDFAFELTLENPRPQDLGLIAIGLQEFISGMVPLGGIRSRGLGQCHLEDVVMAQVDFTQPAALKNYLVNGWPQSQPLGNFIEQQITALQFAGGGNDA
jgi:CRISPR/Cas system CSM-associated protein Csm3 (group 7 of RAMP superfamily)